MSNKHRFFLGCAVFAYSGWKNILFESHLSKDQYLQQYSKFFHSVEGNSFFYGIPSLEIIRKWQCQVPQDFLFVPKIPREYSHQGALFPKRESIASYVELLQRGFGNNLGPIFLQLSPSYSEDYGQDLSLFLNYWRRTISIPICVELRHINWFSSPYQDRIHVMLSKMDICKVILDTRPIYNAGGDPQKNCQNRKPNLPVSFQTTSQICVVRYIGHPDQTENDRYLEEWSIVVAQWLEEKKRVFFFVHCPEEQHSPNIAYRFYKKLKECRPSVRKFDFDPNKITQQLSLF